MGLLNEAIAIERKVPATAAALLIDAYHLGLRDPALEFLLPGVIERLVPSSTTSVPGLCAKAVSGSGTRVALQAPDGGIEIRELQTGEVVVRDLGKSVEANDFLRHVTLSHDGTRLAVTRSNVDIWDVASRTLVQRLVPPTPALSAAFTKDGNRVAVRGPFSGSIWTLGRAEPTLHFSAGPHDQHFWMNSKGTLAGVRTQNGLFIYDVAQKKVLHHLRLPSDVTSVKFYDSADVVLVADSWGLARAWNLTSGAPLGVWGNVGDVATEVALSPDGQWLAAGRRDGWVIVWDVESKLPIGETLVRRSLSELYFVGKSLFVAWFDPSGRGDVNAILWDPRYDLQMASWRDHEWSHPVIRSEEVINLTNCRVNTWKLRPTRLRQSWETNLSQVTFVQYGEQPGQLLVGNDDRVELIATRSSPMTIATSFNAASLSLVQLPASLTDPLSHDLGNVAFLAEEVARRPGSSMWKQEPPCSEGSTLSPNGQLLLTCGDYPRLWDLPSGRLLGELAQPARLTAAAFSDGGNFVLTVTAEGVVQAWNVARESQTWEELVQSVAQVTP